MTADILPWPAGRAAHGSDASIFATIDEAPVDELWSVAAWALDQVSEFKEEHRHDLVTLRRRLLAVATAAVMRMLDEEDAPSEELEPDPDGEPDDGGRGADLFSAKFGSKPQAPRQDPEIRDR